MGKQMNGYPVSGLRSQKKKKKIKTKNQIKQGYTLQVACTVGI